VRKYISLEVPYTNKLIGGTPIGLMILLVKHLQIKLLKLDLGKCWANAVFKEWLYLCYTEGNNGD